jgi:hypothetical protein
LVRLLMAAVVDNQVKPLICELIECRAEIRRGATDHRNTGAKVAIDPNDFDGLRQVSPSTYARPMEDSYFQHAPGLQVCDEVVIELTVGMDRGFVGAFESQGL